MATLPNPSIFLSAGEASGDHYGAQLITELARRLPEATFLGLGGTEMAHSGQRRIVRAEDVAVMGITEILRHIPRIYASYRRLVRALKTERPALAILIDFPDVNFRLAKHCKRLGIPVLWLVSPQLWAWKRRRLRWVQQRVAKMLVIFPFEAAFYRNRGVDAEFIGHPLAYLPMPELTRAQFAARYMPANPDHPGSSSHMNRPWVALLPGSRWKEVLDTLPTLLEAAALLGSGHDFLIPIASTLDKGEFSDLVFKTILPTIKWPASSISLVPDARAALHHARAAVIASGTATVQALTLGTPFIAVYRVSPLTYALAKRLVRYPPEVWPQPASRAEDLPIAMPNLIAGRRIVPELLNRNFTAANVAAALKPLLEKTPARNQMLADLAGTRARLHAPGNETPIEQAADAALALLASSCV